MEHGCRCIAAVLWRIAYLFVLVLGAYTAAHDLRAQASVVAVTICSREGKKTRNMTLYTGRENKVKFIEL